VELTEIEKSFSSKGGTFLVSPFILQQKLAKAKAFIFDWDGVFNNGTKGIGHTSSFSEPDAMGTNLLRFSYWLLHGKLPYTSIITGEANESAISLATREHFTSIYTKSKNKIESFQNFLTVNQLTSDEVVFIFDDVLDLGMAKKCGVKIQVRRETSPLLNSYIRQQTLADYVTFSEGGQHAVREVCELMIGLMGNYDETVTNRLEFSSIYQTYLTTRQVIDTNLYVSNEITLSHK
jgi:3-deoxy-D-manno-octulosonate 8-phosphate phosphatase (KDO 8-P phosphatase)